MNRTKFSTNVQYISIHTKKKFQRNKILWKFSNQNHLYQRKILFPMWNVFFILCFKDISPLRGLNLMAINIPTDIRSLRDNRIPKIPYPVGIKYR